MATFGSMRRRPITAKYQWLMVADPPLCGSGPTLTRLRRCDRQNRGEQCDCRFLINDLAEDLADLQAESLLEWFEDDVDADDVVELVREIEGAIDRADRTTGAGESAERGRWWVARLRRVASAGSGLTGRYSDDLDD